MLLHSLIAQNGPHAATPMHMSAKFQEKKLLKRKSTPPRTGESSERKDDSPLQNTNIEWTTTSVYIAANLDTEL